MTYQQAIKEFGDYKALAGALNLPFTTVHSWRTRGIPIGRQYQIQALGRGGLKAKNGAK